jgi:hypothetical protein
MNKYHWRFGMILAAPLALALLFAGCSSDDNSTNPGDTTAPAAITVLTTAGVTVNSVDLAWTAPGDDGSTGTARTYDIRYSTATITEGNWGSATQVSGEPTPAAAGTAQTFTVSGLSADTPYFFAMKTADEVPNWSGLSVVAQARTSQGTGGDTTPPAAITTLSTGATTASSIVLSWTATGDDGTTGTAAQYDIRYSTSAIDAANFAAATPVTGEPLPTAGGTAQNMTVTGLSASTPYHFAMKVADEVPNWSALSNVVQATTAQAGDTTPPAAVSNLSGTALDETSIELTWTAPGDDGSTGTASSYDIRYSSSTITNANWASATQVTGEPTPVAASGVQHVTVSGLDPDHDYHFAMKTGDEVPNWAAISNDALVHTPASQTAPPGLLSPDFPDSVCISSQDQYAQLAKMLATSQLMVVTVYSSLATGFFGPLNSADWNTEGDCWDYEYGYSGCTGHYNVCLSGSVYTYTLTLNGSCYGPTYDNWVAYRAVTDIDSRTATFYIYDTNATTIATAWTWTWAENNLSGTFTFYEGDPSTSEIQGSVVWSKSADENIFDMTYETPGVSRAVSHFVKEPCSGWYKTYNWDDTGSQWWLENDIAWNADQTGLWDVYDDSGELQAHHVW